MKQRQMSLLELLENRTPGKEKDKKEKILPSPTKTREMMKILKDLGKQWSKMDEDFGYTHISQIAKFALMQEFNRHFFTQYRKSDFKNVNIDEYLGEEQGYIIINDFGYKSDFIQIAKRLLGENKSFYQHKKLRLLFGKNGQIGFLICPKIID
ncbi:MAG: hypothetical protein ACTSUE_15640 [Promethearchaeota archaeon]